LGRVSSVGVSTLDPNGSSYIVSRTESTEFNERGQVSTLTTQSIVAGSLVITGVIHYEYDSVGRQTRVSSRGVGFQPANPDDYENLREYSFDSLGRLATAA
jgi:hypothetical protein